MDSQTEQNPWVIRSDFSDTAKWEHICKLISAPQGEDEFFAHVQYVNDSKYQGHSPQDLVLSLPDTYRHEFCFVVDQECVQKQEHPLLVIGFYPSDDESFGRLPRDTPPSDILTFRALPSQIQGIENNLSIANMDYEDFSDSVDGDGIFRGFS
ncbi:hypothetical protein D0962_04205 [Leptolyngbyaceae cyanobacterium CCMR0082]|uniref:DUF6924 domain-containing protein n=1 Tax=Adonisia turfae CCMR0082 TaxID=2304604 RepID=A0A6M0S1J5_9CYAN|nr:hypothetical protein [Adonisia turfae]NEZ61983.1 hypothetical protein [Adonisia turfae CCMR0082]